MALPAQEDFSTANDPLTTSANWGQCGATLDSGKAETGTFRDESGNSNDKSAYWVTDTFNAKQYFQIAVKGSISGDDRIGGILRGSAGNEAVLMRFRGDGNFEAFYYNTSGTRIALAGNPYTPSATVAADDTFRGEIDGTTLTLKIDYGAGFVTETTWDASSGPGSGSVGCYIVAPFGGMEGGDWEGGNLSAGAGISIPVVINHLKKQGIQ